MGPIVMPGTGLPGRLALGCEPVASIDFLDSGSWTARRVLPRDCALVRANPPVFVWRQPPDRDLAIAWVFLLEDGLGRAVLNASTAHPRLALAAPLPPGRYAWRVRYTPDGGEPVTSDPRQFEIGAETPTVVFPTGAAVAAAVAARPHPRILPTGASFDVLAATAMAGDLADGYVSLLNAAEEAAAAELPAEPVDPGGGGAARNAWTRSVSRLVVREHRRIEALGYGARFTASAADRDAGIARLLNLAAWSPTGATSDEAHDVANRELLLALAQGFDLLFDDLDTAQRGAVIDAIRSRAAQAIGHHDRLDLAPFDSHDANGVLLVLEALLYTAGTAGFDEGEAWLASTFELELATLNTWGGDEGGFGNGVGYGWNYLVGLPTLLAAVRVVAGVDLARHPWVAGFGDFLLAMTAAAGDHRGAFGDDVENTQQYAWYAGDDYRLLARLTGAARHAWYWRAGAAAWNPDRYVSPWHVMLLGLDLPELAGAAPDRHSFGFDDAGVVALHSDVAAPDRSSLLFRSSEFGSHNHSHADQNAFVFVSGGQDLLISGGYYPYYLSPHHALVGRATRYKNALTFDGGIGQAEPSPLGPGAPVQSRDARGRLLNLGDARGWAVTTGDAALAYRSYDAATRTWSPLLTGAIRSVAYHREARIAVIYDHATSAAPRRWELNLNALEPFTADGDAVRIEHQGASACIATYGPAGGFELTSGFALAPEDDAATQYQAHFVVDEPSPELVAVMVIREGCDGAPVEVDIDGTRATVTIGGAAIEFEDKTVMIP